MLTEIFIEAILVDEDLADAVWEAWNKGEIDDAIACLTWMMIAILCRCLAIRSTGKFSARLN